jgi:hypothetical protein
MKTSLKVKRPALRAPAAACPAPVHAAASTVRVEDLALARPAPAEPRLKLAPEAPGPVSARPLEPPDGTGMPVIV